MLEDILVPIFGIIFTFGAPAVIFWQMMATRHRERLTIIERGLDPAQYAALYGKTKAAADPLRALKWALLFLLVGGGLWLGSWLVQVFNFPHMTIFGLALIGGGLALVIYYMVASKQKKSVEPNSGNL